MGHHGCLDRRGSPPRTTGPARTSSGRHRQGLGMPRLERPSTARSASGASEPRAAEQLIEDAAGLALDARPTLSASPDQLGALGPQGDAGDPLGEAHIDSAAPPGSAHPAVPQRCRSGAAPARSSRSRSRRRTCPARGRHRSPRSRRTADNAAEEDEVVEPVILRIRPLVGEHQRATMPSDRGSGQLSASAVRLLRSPAASASSSCRTIDGPRSHPVATARSGTPAAATTSPTAIQDRDTCRA